jgi:hypothetical protein
MTKDELIDMATQSGFSVTHTSNLGVELYLCNPKDIQRFAKLVADKEREACMNCYSTGDDVTDWIDKILARGEA